METVDYKISEQRVAQNYEDDVLPVVVREVW